MVAQVLGDDQVVILCLSVSAHMPLAHRTETPLYETNFSDGTHRSRIAVRTALMPNHAFDFRTIAESLRCSNMTNVQISGALQCWKG